MATPYTANPDPQMSGAMFKKINVDLIAFLLNELYCNNQYLKPIGTVFEYIHYRKLHAPFTILDLTINKSDVFLVEIVSKFTN